jgi:hypothetical protein
MRQSHRYECRERFGGHRGEVAQVGAEGLAADSMEIVGADAEIYAVGEQVGRDDDVRVSD